MDGLLRYAATRGREREEGGRGRPSSEEVNKDSEGKRTKRNLKKNKTKTKTRVPEPGRSGAEGKPSYRKQKKGGGTKYESLSSTFPEREAEREKKQGNIDARERGEEGRGKGGEAKDKKERTTPDRKGVGEERASEGVVKCLEGPH